MTLHKRRRLAKRTFSSPFRCNDRIIPALFKVKASGHDKWRGILYYCRRPCTNENSVCVIYKSQKKGKGKHGKGKSSALGSFFGATPSGSDPLPTRAEHPSPQVDPSTRADMPFQGVVSEDTALGGAHAGWFTTESVWSVFPVDTVPDVSVPSIPSPGPYRLLEALDLCSSQSQALRTLHVFCGLRNPHLPTDKPVEASRQFHCLNLHTPFNRMFDNAWISEGVGFTPSTM